jgi:hypothetical protein
MLTSPQARRSDNCYSVFNMATASRRACGLTTFVQQHPSVFYGYVGPVPSRIAPEALQAEASGGIDVTLHQSLSDVLP